MKELGKRHPRLHTERRDLGRPPKINKHSARRMAIPKFKPQRGETVKIKVVATPDFNATDFLAIESNNETRNEMLREMNEACSQKMENSGGDYLGRFHGTLGFVIVKHPSLGWVRAEIAPLPGEAPPGNKIRVFAVDHGRFGLVEFAKVLVMRARSTVTSLRRISGEPLT